MPTDEEEANVTLSSPPSLIAEKAGLCEVKCWTHSAQPLSAKGALDFPAAWNQCMGQPSPLAAMLPVAQ